jgi:IS605 OrfB family transposase
LLAIGEVLKKSVLLNTLLLTPKKQVIFEAFFSEYLRVLNKTLEQLPNANSSNQLHHLTYLNIRSSSFLSSDVVQEARKDVWAKRKTVKNGFRHCLIRLNKRWFRLVKSKRGNPIVKVTYSPSKTFAIPLRLDRGFQRFKSFLNDGWNYKVISLLENGRINMVLEKTFPKPVDDRRFVVGVDVGSSTLAAVTVFDAETSKVERQLYFGRDVAEKQRRFFERRRKLQSYADKGSGKAKKYLLRLKRKQRNFVKNRSGEVAKQVVAVAEKYGASVAVERLSIRGRKRMFRKKSNREINLIPYGKLREFLSSDCEENCVLLQVGDAYHTSKWCPHCGAVNNVHYSANYSLYKCVCGLTVNSDRKASLAIAVKAVLERKTQDLTNPMFFQISSTRVPVNGLVRPDADVAKVTVQHIQRPMESHCF